jgi:hypothetical protein
LLFKQPQLSLIILFLLGLLEGQTAARRVGVVLTSSGGLFVSFQFCGQGWEGRLGKFTAIRKENRWDTSIAPVNLFDEFRRLFILINVNVHKLHIVLDKHLARPAAIAAPKRAIKHNFRWFQ